MKTSNKLLITLAALLIIIPIVVIAVNVKMNYKDRKSWIEQAKNADRLSTASEGFTSAETKLFSAVQVADAKDMFLSIRLIKDEKSGIKIPEEFKDQVGYTVDEEGALQLVFKTKKDQVNRYIQLYIYAPNFKEIGLNQLSGLDLRANIDSLALQISKSGNINFGEHTKINKLVVHAEDISKFSVNDGALNGLFLTLKNGEFGLESASLKDLNISASGRSIVTLEGDREQKEKYTIDHLVLKTLDKGEVNIENIKINQSLGSLSDSTQVNMPAAYLKQLLKP